MQGGDEFWQIHACCFFHVLFSAARLSVIHNKDLLATIHLLVAMVRCFQPELDLPLNVKVEVLHLEVSFFSSFSTFLLWAGLSHTLLCPPPLWFTLIFIQVTGGGIRSHVETEVLTDKRWGNLYSVGFGRCENSWGHLFFWLLQQRFRRRLPQQYWR